MIRTPLQLCNTWLLLLTSEMFALAKFPVYHSLAMETTANRQHHFDNRPRGFSYKQYCETLKRSECIGTFLLKAYLNPASDVCYCKLTILLSLVHGIYLCSLCKTSTINMLDDDDDNDDDDDRIDDDPYCYHEIYCQQIYHYCNFGWLSSNREFSVFYQPYRLTSLYYCTYVLDYYGMWLHCKTVYFLICSL